MESVPMMTGLGVKVTGMVSGLVLSMIGPVTGLGTRTTGVLGLRTGPGTQKWWSSTEVQPQSSNGAASSSSDVPQDAAKNEPPQNVSAVIVDSSDQSAPRVARLFGEQSSG